MAVCHNGHTLTPDNVYIIPSGRQTGEAQCRACRKVSKDKYRQTSKGKTAEIRSHHKNMELRPEKHKARMQVSWAVRSGQLVKPDICEINVDCWGRIEAHHEDYSKPLEVKWLCMGHHRKVHND